MPRGEELLFSYLKRLKTTRCLKNRTLEVGSKSKANMDQLLLVSQPCHTSATHFFHVTRMLIFCPATAFLPSVAALVSHITSIQVDIVRLKYQKSSRSLSQS